MRRRLSTLVLFLACSLASTTHAEDRRSRETPASRVAAKTRGAVISLKALQTIPARLDADEVGRVHNLGTGLVFDPRGFVVTNYHVVARVQRIDATYPAQDGKKVERITARVVCFDEATDLAVLKLDGPGPFQFVSLSEGVEPIHGEDVIAIGNPYGLSNSLAVGVVSAIDREMKLPNGYMFPNLIQVSAAINHGNSGGPLFDVNGHLLGINAAIRSNAQNIAFAIPTANVIRVIRDMMPGPFSLSGLGLTVEARPAPGGNAENDGTSLFVQNVVKGSAAFEAGIVSNTEMVSIDRNPVTKTFDLERAFWNRRYGEVLPVVVRQNGKERQFQLRCEIFGQPPTATERVWRQLGAWVSTVPPKRLSHLQAKYEGGLLVLAVQKGSTAERAGLEPGDVIVGLNERAMLEAGHLVYMIENHFEQSLPCRYMRDGELKALAISMPPLEASLGAPKATVNAGAKAETRPQ